MSKPWTAEEEREPPRPTTAAMGACARWLQACLELGWSRNDLNALEALWWQHHDHRGNLVDALDA